MKTFSAVISPWAVVLVVCVVGFLGSCVKGAPLLLQVDPTTLVGHKLVIAIEPLLSEVVTHMNIGSNTHVDILNSTVDATNDSNIFYGFNSVDASLPPEALEMVSADAVITETGIPTTTASAMADPLATEEGTSPSQQRSETSDTFAGDDQNTNNINENPDQEPQGISLRGRFRPHIPFQDDVDNFLINFPHRCPDGWKFEYGECRQPFNRLNDIARPKSKAMRRRKIKIMT